MKISKCLFMFLFCLVQMIGMAVTEEEAIELLQQEIGKADPFEQVTPVSTSPPAGEVPVNSEARPRPTEPLAMKTVMLKFLRAENVARAAAGMSSPFGSVGVDAETNSLVLVDEPDVLERMVTEIRNADRTPQQVLIEVMIIDVKLGDEDEIGVNWENLLGGAEEAGLDSDQVFIDNFPTGLSLSLVKNDVRATLFALQQMRDVEILASPRVLVISGQEAEIKTVEEIPYQEVIQTAEGGLLTQTEFKEVGVTLLVRPTVTDEGKIQLAIQPKQSVQTGETLSEVPVIDTRQARTMLMIEDGQVVVLGGLRRKEVRVSTDKVPLLGDLPLLGLLFSREKREVMNSELVVLLSPHLESGHVPTPRQRELFDWMREQPMLELPKDQTNLENAYKPVDAAVEAAGETLGIQPPEGRKGFTRPEDL